MSGAPFASEDRFLQAISARFPNTHPHMTLGRGDDCAVLACPPSLAVTTDLFVENVHFSRAYFSAADVGYKALAVNISDAAAMGAAPVGFSLGLAGPPDTPAAFWEEFLDAMAQLAASLNLALTGGDLTACAHLVVAVTLWAAPGDCGRLITRGGCREGDALFAVGGLGLSRVGLFALGGLGRARAEQDFPAAVAAHLRPEVRVAQGLALAGAPGVVSLMDVSDGLASDLPRLVGPGGLGADLIIPPERIHPEVVRMAAAAGEDPAQALVLGGEDYALLGACRFDALTDVLAACPEAYPIGRVRRGEGISLDGKPFEAAGFDHFHK